MPGLSIANVRLSMRLIEDSVQAASAKIAISKRVRISAYAKAYGRPIGCLNGVFVQGRRRPRAPLRANHPPASAGTAARSDTKDCRRARAAIAIPADAAIGAM